MLKNIPVVLEGYKLRVTEEPEVKTYKNKETGLQEVATDPQNANSTLYVVSLLMKQLPSEGRPTGKSFEVKVTVETDPTGQVEEGQLVELHNPRISQWDMNGRQGVSMRASGIKAVA
ncbi:hypothetical protein [Parasphingorhabdus pacifica]